MIKISKKVAFIVMIIMSILFVISLRSINWENLKEGKDIFKEINSSVAPFLLIIIYFIYYMKRLKEERKDD